MSIKYAAVSKITKNSLNDQKIFHHGHENNSDDLRPI